MLKPITVGDAAMRCRCASKIPSPPSRLQAWWRRGWSAPGSWLGFRVSHLKSRPGFSFGLRQSRPDSAKRSVSAGAWRARRVRKVGGDLRGSRFSDCANWRGLQRCRSKRQGGVFRQGRQGDGIWPVSPVTGCRAFQVMYLPVNGIMWNKQIAVACHE